ncbi:hypothetical protein LguiA_012936 [Lonicera macranthoides]
MIIQQRFFEHGFNVVVLLVLSCKKLNFGVNSVVGDGTMKNWCMENEKEALLMFKQGVVDHYHILSSWGREEDKKDCCKWRGVKCSNRTGHIHVMLPDSLLKFVNFPTIDLRSNHLNGPIPLLPRNMSSLNLSKNMFSRSIISLYSIATEFLSYLDLSNNQLSGEVPDYWIRAKHLKIIDLANNNFSGKIPTTFGFKSQLNILNLPHNNFIGELPSSLKNCKMLEVIDMSENKLSGKLPAWIVSHLRSLVVLNFRINQFYGSIPLDMCHLNRTQVLDLSQNKIS